MTTLDEKALARVKEITLERYYTGHQ